MRTLGSASWWARLLRGDPAGFRILGIYLFRRWIYIYIYIYIYSSYHGRRLRTISQVSHVKLDFALFWSDVVASAFTGTRFLGVHGFRHLEVCKSPWSLRGSRVYAPHGCMGLMAGYAACCTPYIRHFPLVPVQRWSIELRPQPLGSGGDAASCEDTMEDFWTVPLTFCHHVSLQGGF